MRTNNVKGVYSSTFQACANPVPFKNRKLFKKPLQNLEIFLAWLKKHLFILPLPLHKYLHVFCQHMNFRLGAKQCLTMNEW